MNIKLLVKWCHGSILTFGVHLRRNFLSFMKFIVVSSVLVTIFQCKTYQNHSPLRTKYIMKILALIERLNSAHRIKHSSPSYQFYYETRYVTKEGGVGYDLALQ